MLLAQLQQTLPRCRSCKELAGLVSCPAHRQILLLPRFVSDLGVVSDKGMHTKKSCEQNEAQRHTKLIGLPFASCPHQVGQLPPLRNGAISFAMRAHLAYFAGPADLISCNILLASVIKDFNDPSDIPSHFTLRPVEPSPYPSSFGPSLATCPASWAATEHLETYSRMCHFSAWQHRLMLWFLSKKFCHPDRRSHHWPGRQKHALARPKGSKARMRNLALDS